MSRGLSRGVLPAGVPAGGLSGGSGGSGWGDVLGTVVELGVRRLGGAEAGVPLPGERVSVSVLRAGLDAALAGVVRWADRQAGLEARAGAGADGTAGTDGLRDGAERLVPVVGQVRAMVFRLREAVVAEVERQLDAGAAGGLREDLESLHADLVGRRAWWNAFAVRVGAVRQGDASGGEVVAAARGERGLLLQDWVLPSGSRAVAVEQVRGWAGTGSVEAFLQEQGVSDPESTVRAVVWSRPAAIGVQSTGEGSAGVALQRSVRLARRPVVSGHAGVALRSPRLPAHRPLAEGRGSLRPGQRTPRIVRTGRDQGRTPALVQELPVTGDAVSVDAVRREPAPRGWRWGVIKGTALPPGRRSGGGVCGVSSPRRRGLPLVITPR